MGDSTQQDAMELLAKWRLCRDRQKFRVQDGCCVLSPMDEMVWFATPQFSEFDLAVNAAAPTRLALANPMRVGYTISQVGAQSKLTGSITTVDSVVFGPLAALNDLNIITGFVVNASFPTFEITCDKYPGIVQSEIWAQAYSPVASVHTIGTMLVEIILRDWPKLE